MRCEQCAERENAEAGVCQRPVVVECTHERALCLTRRISLDGGRTNQFEKLRIIILSGISALEKMCVLPETAKAWFGDNSAEVCIVIVFSSHWILDNEYPIFPFMTNF